MMSRRTRPLDPDVTTVHFGRGQTLLLIGLGGALGTAVRSALETALPAAAGTWPWSTFCINVTGAFVLAVLLESLSVLGPDEGWLRGIRFGVGTGMLGGYTTYSTFMVEAARLGRSGDHVIAFGYVAATVLLGFVAAWAGMSAVSALQRRSRRGRR